MSALRRACSLASALLWLASLSCDAGPESSGPRFALLTPGPVSDEGWNAQAYEGLERLRREFGALTRHVEVGAPIEFERALRSFGRQGFDAVFAHGFEFGEAVRRVAPDFPDTVFCVTSGDVTGPNVCSIRFRIEEPARLAGLLAASLSHSGVIGAVGGMDIPPVRSAFEAFERGAKEADPDARVLVSWIGSWEDAASARQAAVALVDRGADVLFHDADAAGLGVLHAAKDRGIPAIGCNRDQAPLFPETVVASVVLDVGEAFAAVARDVLEGEFARRDARIYVFDLGSGACDLVMNPRFAERLAPEVLARLDRARRAILESP